MHALDLLNRRAWYLRLPIKGALLALTVLFICFPYPRLLLTNLERWKDPDRLIEPDHPGLKSLAGELRSELASKPPPRDVLRRVQRFVYRKVPYEWDWNNWGVADYLPTVSEVLDRGKEDCDGQAVIAASLLRSLGYDAYLVNDLTHMWVRTEFGDTMSPGETPVAVATEKGIEVRRPPVLASLRALAMGIAVFPMARELVIVVVFWLLLLRRETGLLCAGGALLLLVAGLHLVRAGGGPAGRPNEWLQAAGAAVFVSAVGLVLLRNRTRARTTPPPAQPA